jgi:hypothetical protein
MRNKSILQYCFLLYILFVTACSAPEKPVTKEEATAVAASLTEAMAQRNPGRLNELFDLTAFEKRIREESQNKLDKTMLAGAIKGMRSGDFSRQIVKSLGKKGSYELVKQYEKNNHQHLVFRLYNEQLNYHDFELIKKEDKVRIADIYIYTTGENLSSTLMQTLLSMSEQPAAAKQVDQDDVQNIQRIKSYINEAEFEKANRLFKGLPAVIRNQKMYKIINIQIASGLGNDVYLAALNKYQQEYPDAPNMYLLMIDAYFLKKDYAGALRCVNSLDSLINKDPFLDYYRALICKESEDHANQLVYLEKLQKNMPAFGDGTLQLINAYAEGKQLDKAVALTKQYRTSKDPDTETLDALYLLYPDFKKKMETVSE